MSALALHQKISKEPPCEITTQNENQIIECTSIDMTISFKNEDELFEYIDNNDNLLTTNEENGYIFSLYKDSFVVIDGITDFSQQLLIPNYWGGYKIIAIRDFGGSNLVKEVIIPNGVEFILAPLTEYNNLEKISLPKSLKFIQNGAFAKCDSLKCVSIPESIETITSCLFSECTKLNTVKLGSNVKTIEGDAFFYCKSLEKLILPESIEMIQSNAFDNCINLTYINFPASLVSISNSAFNNCSKLKIDRLPEGIQKIGVRAFYNCSNLRELIIPNSVTEIGANAFKGCTNLTIISSSNYVIEYAKANGISYRKPLD